MAQLPAQSWAGEDGIATRLHAEVDPLVACSLACAVLFATRAPLRWLKQRIEGSRALWVTELAQDASLIACFVACVVCVAATTFRPFLYFRF
jgi:hypothetical protein